MSENCLVLFLYFLKTFFKITRNYPPAGWELLIIVKSYGLFYSKPNLYNYKSHCFLDKSSNYAGAQKLLENY